MKASAASDYAPWEVVVTILLAASVQIGALLMFHFGQKNLIADLPSIDKGAELPVKVQPVLDLEGLTLKLGGKKPVLPDMWQAPKPVAPRPPQQQATSNDDPTISTKKDDTEKPDKKEKHDAGPDTPPDAGEQDIPDASAPEETADAPPTDDPKPEGNKNEGDDAGAENGNTTNKTLITQRNAYYARIGAFLARFGRSHCNGAKGSLGGSVSLSGQTVTSVSMGASGNAEMDANVIPAMQAAVGQQVPPPPDDHPEWLQPSFPVQINCN